MGRIAIYALFACFLLAAPACAGAWMREEGTGFFSSSIEHDGVQQGNSSTYLEYGLRPDLTMGLEISIELFPESSSTSYAGFFLRRPLGNPDGTNRWAWRLGAGAAWSWETTQPYLETGLHWGRGLELWQRNGWAAVDGTLKWETMTGGQIAKVDATVGLELTERLKGMLQVFLEYDQDRTTRKLSPSVLWAPPDFGEFTFQFGAVIEQGNEDHPTLKLGLWREF